MSSRPRTYVDLALAGEYPATPEPEEIDEDLAWVEREIRKIEDGPRLMSFDTPTLNRIRNERLHRLQRMRARLLGEEPA